MTTGATEKRVSLPPDDLARVRRLTEEVKSRLYEVSLISGRTLGRDLGQGEVVKYEVQQRKDRPVQTVEVVVIKLPDGTFCCTQDPPGEITCPC